MDLPELTLVDTAKAERAKRRGRERKRRCCCRRWHRDEETSEKENCLRIMRLCLRKIDQCQYWRSIVDRWMKGTFLSNLKPLSKLLVIRDHRSSQPSVFTFRWPSRAIVITSGYTVAHLDHEIRRPALMSFLFSFPLDIPICYHPLCAYILYQIRNDVLSLLPCPHVKTSGSREHAHTDRTAHD